MKHFRTQYTLPLTGQDEEVNVDLFAGGGGASTGLEMGLQRAVHLAINHNPAALSMHQVNHPGTIHLETDVWDVDPVHALAGRRIGWLHASPDCTHHSQAGGGQPRKKEIRDLSWVVIRWAAVARPRVISLENVKQIQQWGPLIAKRCTTTGRVVKIDRTVAAPGERVPRGEQYLVPDPKRKGLYWRTFLQCLRDLGYLVDHWVLKNCNYGDPTSRERLYLVARNDGIAPVKPLQTHFAKPKRGQKAWRTAAECIDWSIPSQSIFTRKRPLADATMRRIAKGIVREVIGRKQPFIVPIANWSTDSIQPVDRPLSTVTAYPKGGSHAVIAPVVVPVTHQGADRMHSVQEPMRTITAAHRGELAVASPVLVGVGGRAGQTEPRSAETPMHTITAKADTGIATAFLAQANAGFNTTHSKPVDAPITTITNTGSQQQLVTAFLAHLRGNCDARPLGEPLRTVSAGGQHHGVVELELSKENEEGALRCAAFLISYYGKSFAHEMDAPLNTITTKPRLAMVTVWIGGDPYVIVDIHLRMLQPTELYRAQGFPSNYIIDRGHDGRLFTKTEQVHMCGNSVSPGTMAAIASANNPWNREEQRIAA